MPLKPTLDFENNSLNPGFYIHTKTKEIIQLHTDAAGFRMSYGFSGEKGKIFNQSKSTDYKRLNDGELALEVSKSNKRASWLKTGLEKKTIASKSRSNASGCRV